MPDGSPGSRPLPRHIAAQLRSAGGSADTGGQPWAGRNLGEGTSHTHEFPEDDGAASPGIARALEAWRTGAVDETAVVSALSGIRVFVPIVAEVTHSVVTDEGLVADKEADMALVSLQTPDGRKALPVFTSVGQLSAWHQQARPVAVDIRKAALSAVQDGSDLLVVDAAAQPAFVVRRPALWSVAKAEPWVPSYADPRVDDAVMRAGLGIPEVLVARTEPGPGIHAMGDAGAPLRGGAAGPELSVVLQLSPGLSRAHVEQVVGRYQEQLSTEPLLAEAVDSLALRLTG